MAKANILDINGNKTKDIVMPRWFYGKIREDIVSKVIEAKKIKQPYAPSILAGRQSSVSGKIIHQRHVWKSQYGRGMSRVPRKTMSRRGNQFNWVGATAPNTRGGRRAHPPKVLSMINTNKINKKELKMAFISALSATADINVVVRKKTQRAGKGKLRGRKYKKTAGVLFVTGSNEKLKSSAFESISAKGLSITDLAKGGLGRLTIYTENAIKDIDNRLKSKMVNIKEIKK